MKSGLKVLVNSCDIGHDALPIRPLCVHHLVYVLESNNSQSGWRKQKISGEEKQILNSPSVHRIWLKATGGNHNIYYL